MNLIEPIPDNPSGPILVCKHCKKECTRSPIDNLWCHLDEELCLVNGEIMLSPDYDHAAEPDVIVTRIVTKE